MRLFLDYAVKTLTDYPKIKMEKKNDSQMQKTQKHLKHKVFRWIYLEASSCLRPQKKPIYHGTLIANSMLLMKHLAAILFIFVLCSASAFAQPLRQLPTFPPGYEQSNGPVNQVLQAYDQEEYLEALVQAKQIQSELSDHLLSETLAYMIGDLYIKLAETENPAYLHKALQAFQDARVIYPETENSVRALWRIGQIYRSLDLHYESLASFQRILKHHPENPYAPKSLLGIAQTYRAWEKWDKANQSFKKIKLGLLDRADRQSTLLGHADVYYHMGSYRQAYTLYENIEDVWSGVTKRDMPALFQHADTAYRTKHPEQANALFLYLFNVFPKTDTAPTALFRVGDGLRVNEQNRQAQNIYTQVATLYPESFAAHLSHLIKSLSDLKCVTQAPQATGQPFVDCPATDEEAPKSLSDIVSDIQGSIDSLFKEEIQAPVIGETILRAAVELKNYGYFHEAIGTLNALSQRRLPFQLQRAVRLAYQKTTAEAIEHMHKHGEDVKIIELIHTYPSALTPSIRLQAPGMTLAKTYRNLNLYGQALKLYEAIVAQKRNPHIAEARYQIAQTYFSQGKYDLAQQHFAQYLSRYRKNAWMPHASAGLAQSLHRMGQTQKAIKHYQAWLKRYPTHPQKKHMSMALADAYLETGKASNASRLYRQLANSNKEPSSDLYLKAADAYYRQKNYSGALKFYEMSLKYIKDQQQAEWARFQMANSYMALDQIIKGQSIFKELGQNASDPIIQKMALEQNRGIAEETALNAGG